MKPLEPRNVERLLVRGTNWVGDAIMSLPALKRIRTLFPGARISLLVLPWVSGIYEGVEFVDELLLYERNGRHAGLPGKWRLARDLRRERFEAAILFQNAFEAAALTWLAGIPARAGYDRDGRRLLLTHALPLDPRVKKVHQAYYYLDLVERLAGAGDFSLARAPVCSAPAIPVELMPDISLEVNSSRKQRAWESLAAEGVDSSKPLVGVNPGAFFGSAKRWPADRFGLVLDRLLEEAGANVVLFGSSNEKGIAEAIVATMQRRPVVLSGKTSLSELIALMACCDLFIANDSGPMHLAAALRIPTLAIFGSTDDVATGPLSPRAVVINKRVECSPCLLRECPIDLRCMTQIEAAEVYSLAVENLGSARPSES
jgi:heptosyltransferase-2